MNIPQQATVCFQLKSLILVTWVAVLPLQGHKLQYFVHYATDATSETIVATKITPQRFSQGHGMTRSVIVTPFELCG